MRMWFVYTRVCFGHIHWKKRNTKWLPSEELKKCGFAALVERVLFRKKKKGRKRIVERNRSSNSDKRNGILIKKRIFFSSLNLKILIFA